MNHAALIAFVTAWAMQGQPYCAPVPTVQVLPCFDQRSGQYQDTCTEQSPSGRTTYEKTTLAADAGSLRTVYRVWIVRRAGGVAGTLFFRDSTQTNQHPNLDVFLQNAENGTLQTRTRPATCDLPVTEGFDP